MAATLSAHEQAASISAAAAMFSQCSLDDATEAFKGACRDFDGRYSDESKGCTASRIRRRNAVGNLFEGVDLAFIKQLTAGTVMELH
uniref:Uncharacterized protein n=1 Tax=Parascaris univalens TaxID=6257 RepID=A0A915AC24_PARUN